MIFIFVLHNSPTKPDTLYQRCFDSKRLTPRAVIAKLKNMQMLDVHLPTTDGKQLVLTRYTQPEKEHKMLINQMKLNLPKQSPPKITANGETISRQGNCNL